MSVPQSPTSVQSRPISPSPSRSSFSLTSPFQLIPPPLSSNTQSSKRAARNLALRRFYGLESSSGSSTSNGNVGITTSTIPGINAEDFDASKFVDEFISKASLQELVRTENEISTGAESEFLLLITEIKNIDGERKALVYDNYSKLIAATDTIQRVFMLHYPYLTSQMRANLEPLDPETSQLIPALDHITSLCIALGKKLKQEVISQNENVPKFTVDDPYKYINAVQWAIDGPLRIQTLVSQGKYDEARKEYDTLVTETSQWNAKDISTLRADAKKAIDDIPP